jgi:hypothetical protein
LKKSIKAILERLKPEDPFLALISLTAAVLIASYMHGARPKQAKVNNQARVRKILPKGK